MSKVLAKGSSPLKFDTSSGNLACFIRASTPPRTPRYSSYAGSFRTRKKSRLPREQQIEFQDKAFLESVLCKILNDADCEGITELIDNMVFPSTTTTETDGGREPQPEAGEQDEISLVFSDFQSFNKNCSPDETTLFDPSCQQYRIIPPHPQRMQGCSPYNYQDRQAGTFLQASLLDSTAISPRSEEAPEIPPLSYGYGYVGGNYLYRQPSQRKRRNGGDQIQQYKIVPERIEADGRTTLMIRHIPNKYTEEMLFQEIGRNHRLKINFLYLPVDHYNSCNVGYAFVNFIHTKFIRDFYHEFNGRRWDRFNSQKICQLAYARIQGATNLMDHFNAGQLKGRGNASGTAVSRGKNSQEGTTFAGSACLQRSA